MGGSGGSGGSRRAVPATCRICGKTVTSAVDRKVGRCSDCPPSYDEARFEQLKDWRAATAAEAKLPVYVVFTDATLVAIAETMPADEGALARVPGVGAAKLKRYGAAVLGILSG